MQLLLKSFSPHLRWSEWLWRHRCDSARNGCCGGCIECRYDGPLAAKPLAELLRFSPEFFSGYGWIVKIACVGGSWNLEPWPGVDYSRLSASSIPIFTFCSFLSPVNSSLFSADCFACRRSTSATPVRPYSATLPNTSFSFLFLLLPSNCV